MIAKSAQQDVMLPVMTDAADRKNTPITTGVLDYFPAALAEIARVSQAGNEQHNPGQALHWAKAKSTDEADALVRHLLARGTLDTDGVRHSAKMAWRALALLQRELEAAAGLGVSDKGATYRCLRAWCDLHHAPSCEFCGTGLTHKEFKRRALADYKRETGHDYDSTFHED